MDLGSGTGLSTGIWSGKAGSIVGVEPNADMRRQAEVRFDGIPDIRFVDGVSSATGLLDNSADIVTVSQALHWMEPESTFWEVARILRPGGVFAAYDCDWPPTINPAAEEAFKHFMVASEEMDRTLGLGREVVRWEKAGHLDRMRASGRFAWAKELAVHHVEKGDADRLVGVALSQGTVAGVVRALGEEETGVPEFRRAAKEALPSGSAPWYWTYRVRAGIP